MSNQKHPGDGGAVPPEFEHFLRPGPTQGPIGDGQTPKHDQVSETGLADFADLFRDPPPVGRMPSRPTPAAGVAGAPAAVGGTISAGSSRVDPDATRRLGTTQQVSHAGSVATAPPARPTPPQPTSAPAGQPPKTRGGLKRWLIIILVALLAYFGALTAFFALSVNKMNAMPAEQIANTAGDNYLLVGTDGRENLTRAQRKELHTGYTEGNRTDTIMLLHVPLIGQPTLISIPRDSWVPIPGHSDNKINAAYAEGGAPLLIQTVENTTGVHIDHYVEIGMDGVANIADGLGGVTLCPKDNYNDERSGLNVDKGCQTMDGKTALAYVRMRYADPTGDIGRQERQQEYMKSVAMKTANPLTWLNPFKMFSVDSAAANSLTVDESTGIVDDARMAIAMGMISAGWGESTSVPIETDSYWVGGQQAVKWDTPKALELFASIGGA